jgi:hypothetical protein
MEASGFLDHCHRIKHRRPVEDWSYMPSLANLDFGENSSWRLAVLGEMIATARNDNFRAFKSKF